MQRDLLRQPILGDTGLSVAARRKDERGAAGFGVALTKRLLMATALACAILVTHASSRTAIADGAAPARLYPDPLFGVVLLDQSTAIATGYHGAVRLSVDGGATWAAEPSGTEDMLRRVATTSDHHVFAVSHVGKILEADADARGWRTVHDEPGLYLRDIAFATPQVGWAVGHDGVILKTGDGGATWSRQELANYTGRDKPRLSGVAAIDAAHALTVGEFGVIAETHDGGTTWSVISAGQFPTFLGVAVAGNTGYAVGLNGTLVRLANSEADGWSATLVPLGTTQHLLSVALSRDGTEGLIGGNGLLLTLRNGQFLPAKVTEAFALTYAWIGGVAIGASGRAIAVGQGGAILVADRANGTFNPAATGPVTAQTTTASDRVTQ
ncbi:hypothetical protein D3874_25085 [Oleomonas cavernae]|uniref:Photosynthesis system II assembly factor Ycf48/Hcf136-like domain-containing protein n=1 Tax=Oleomonas cavernae TaxID=2320859 RepID=A0A418WH97_9PROT|nr:YCF48-related protein [Oleomonas cavernae]RJF89365.1 hypothetical protein D3874_22295 [Oleomonas cavernae]RJF89833.1 hypothetical protein D3874_25085 [Oleomonas cavernae]